MSALPTTTPVTSNGSAAAAPTTTLTLTEREMYLVHEALHSFLTDFGHDEADVHAEIRQALDKVAAARGTTTTN
jgi:hypothetical protein